MSKIQNLLQIYVKEIVLSKSVCVILLFLLFFHSSLANMGFFLYLCSKSDERQRAISMNVEEIRDFCLSLGTDVEEKFPFVKFKNGDGVLVFYVCGHMFCFFDLNDFQVVSLKCQPERIDELKAQYDCIGNPYNESPKHWIGLDPHTSPDALTKDLIRNSYEIVKAKYTKKK